MAKHGLDTTERVHTAGTTSIDRMREVLDAIDDIRELPDALLPLREEVLANLVMLAQIAAPTGDEEERVRYVLDRFTEAGLPEAGPDEIGNAVGFLPGAKGDRTIIAVAHLDTWIPKTVSHNVVVQTDRTIGAGISDNALGAAIVSMLPTFLDQLGIKLDCNLQLIGTVRSLHRGNHEGLKFFLDHAPRKFDFGIVVEGVELGRLNFFSLGMVRGDIACNVRREHLSRYGSESALVVLNQVVNRMLGISTPSRPHTRIRIGKMHAGIEYNTDPDHAELGFEVVSDSDEMVRGIISQIEDIVGEMSARTDVDVGLDCFFHREAGGIPFSHPLIKTVIEVMTQLGIQPNQEQILSEVSEFIAYGIPAVTLGVTTQQRDQKKTDHVMIDPILTGVAQLVGTIMAIDRGACDER